MKFAKHELQQNRLSSKEFEGSEHPKGGNVSCKAGLKILIALALIFFAELPRLSVYLMEEAFTVLLGIAVMHILVLLAVIAFLLLWEGARLVFLRLKGIVGKITGTRHRPLRAGRAMAMQSQIIDASKGHHRQSSPRSNLLML